MNILKINNTDSLLRDYYQLDEASEKLVVVKGYTLVCQRTRCRAMHGIP